MAERHHPSFSDITKCICGLPMEDHPPRVVAVIGLACPFCREDGFDHVGLKTHLLVDCDDFEKTETGNTFRFETAADRARSKE